MPTHPKPNATVGQVLKKIMEINPDLSAHEMIFLMKESIQVRGGGFQDGFLKQDTIDEEKALELARRTLK